MKHFITHLIIGVACVNGVHAVDEIQIGSDPFDNVFQELLGRNSGELLTYEYLLGQPLTPICSDVHGARICELSIHSRKSSIIDQFEFQQTTLQDGSTHELYSVSIKHSDVCFDASRVLKIAKAAGLQLSKNPIIPHDLQDMKALSAPFLTRWRADLSHPGEILEFFARGECAAAINLYKEKNHGN